MEIQFEKLSKSFVEGENRRMVLENLNIVFPSGKLSVVLGRSGSGKSTILNLISGIDTPDQGGIIIGGQTVSQLSDQKRTLFRRRHIGFVFQFFNLIPTLNVFENVLLNLELDGRADEANRLNAKALLQAVGLADRLTAKPDELSGGEQQRTALVRALAHDPEIILADEPTGNLDQETGGAVLDLMTKLVKEKNKTVVMATHSHDILKEADAVFGIQACQIKQLERESI